MTKGGLHWLIEPITGDRYVRNPEPSEKLVALDRYKRLEPFTPPAIWADFQLKDDRWDPFFMRTYAAYYDNNKQAIPDEPVPITAALKMMGKSYARTHGLTTTIGLPGVMFWAWWHRIPPCWVVITKSQTEKLLSEQEANESRPGK